MAKIFLDLEKLKNPNSGLGQFCLHLSRSIYKIIDNSDLGVYLPKEYAKYYPSSEIILWNRLHKIFKVKVNSNIWHSLHQEAVYFPKDKNIKKVLTIHDLNFLAIYKGAKQLKHLSYLQKLVDNSSAVTFISHFTKEIAENNLNIPSHIFTKVIYNGVAINKSLKPEKPNFIKNYNPFLFTIGIVGEKKNFHTLVEMMKYLPSLKLYISGNAKGTYAEKITKLITLNKLSNQVVLTGGISEAEKIWMYKNCSAFVFPSKNEGFGLPVVEAMSFGKPLVLSNKTSLPEIGGELASYFSSFDSKQMASRVFESINNHSIKDAEELIKRSKKFSWDNAAKEYVKLYEMLQ